MSEEARCTVCKGTKSEHFDADGKQITHHMFTEKEGELISQADHAKAQSQAPRVVVPPNYLGNAGMSVGRLVEVLLAKRILTPDEALYVAGMAPSPAPLHQYADPATKGQL